MPPEAENDNFLAELGLDDGEEQTQETQGSEETNSSAMKELRAALERREKALRKAGKEIEELRQFRTDAVQRERSDTLRVAGLTERQAKVFLATGEDVTPEAVQAFKSEVLQTPPPETSQEEPPTPGFAPTQVGTPPPPGKVYSRAEWIALSATDAATAQRLFQEGRVDLSGLREGLGPEK